MSKKNEKFAKAVKRPRLVLSKEEIEQQAKGIFDFLRLVHPSAIKIKPKEYNKGAIEIRFLLRGDGLTSGSLFSYNTWDLEEKDLQNLINKLSKYNGYSVCTYYSVYTYDWHMEFEKEAKMEKPKKIRKESVMYCESLPADFDNITKEEFLEEKERLLNIGIETLDLFSGHGFQSSILLNDRCYDPDALAEFTKLLLRKGFKVDPKIDHPNHIMRSPFTHNCKEYAKDMPKYYKPIDPQPHTTYVMNWTEKRYDLEDVMNRLEQLEDKPFDTDDMDHLLNVFGSVEVVKDKSDASGKKAILKEKPKVEKKKEAKKPKVKKEEIKVENKEDIAELYQYFDLFSLPEAIQNILMGSPKDFRNDTMFFIVPFLKNALGLSRKEALETLKAWGELCEPPYGEDKLVDDFDRCWDKNIENKSKAKYGKYTPGMRKLYGDLEFDTTIRNDDQIIISNDFFINIKDYSHGAIKFYMAIRYMEYYHKEEKRNDFTKEEIMDFWDWSLATYKRYLSASKKSGLVSRKIREKEDKQKGEKNELAYYPNPFLSSTKRTYGYTKIQSSLFKNLLKEKFSGDEPTLYLYFKFLTNNRGKECFTSQRELGKAIGKTQPAITQMTDRLHDKRFMKKITIENEDGSLDTTYRLLD